MRPLIPLLLCACASAPPGDTRADLTARALHAEAHGNWLGAGQLWQVLYDESAEFEAARGLARALDAQGDPLGAARVLENIAAPDEPLLIQLAGLHQKLGRSDLAEADLVQACRLAPGSMPARRHLASLLLEQQRSADALPILREAVALAPRDPDLWASLARAALASDQSGEAMSAYLALAELRELEFDQAIDATSLLLATGQPEHLDAATAWLERGLEANPDRADAWRLLAQLHGRMARNEERLRALRAALEVDPADSGTLWELGEARAAAGEWERVEALARHARAIGADQLATRFDELLDQRPVEDADDD